MDKSFLIFLAIPIFFIMILIEYTYGKLKGKNNYRLNDTITSINIGLLSRFPTILNLGAQGLVYAYVASYLSLNILPENSIFTWVFAFVLYDFLYYWMHRLHHENKLLWGTHVVIIMVKSSIYQLRCVRQVLAFFGNGFFIYQW